MSVYAITASTAIMVTSEAPEYATLRISGGVKSSTELFSLLKNVLFSSFSSTQLVLIRI